MKNTTKLLSIILVLGMILGVFMALGITASAAEPTLTTDKYDVTGDGVNDSVYEIKTVEDLQWYCNAILETSANLNAILMNDLDLSSVCSETLGSWNSVRFGYMGVFDGNGKTIKNLYISDTGSSTGKYRGLFGYLYNGTIKNLTVTGSVTAYEDAAGFLGYGKCNIINCVNYVDVTVTQREGAGFIGYQDSGSVVDGCVNYGNITQTQGPTASIAGIVSRVYGNVKNCTNFGAISAKGTAVAGIASGGFYNTLVENCVNYGTVSSSYGDYYVSGIVYNSDGEVKNCYYNSSSAPRGVNEVATSENVAAVSAAEMADGSLAYTLSENWGDDWGQEIGVEKAPVYGGMKVYRSITASICSGGGQETTVYSNSETPSKIHDTTLGSESFVDGRCMYCEYECDHSAGYDLSYGNVQDATHDVTYSCCNKVITENHGNWSFSSSEATITATCTCTATDSITLLAPADTAYTGLKKVGSISGSIPGVENPSVVYLTDGMSIGTHTISITLDEATATVTFAIVKGNLSVAVNPETTYEYGDTYVGKAITGGKVVVDGNEALEITGSWAWVDSTTTAIFTPDAEYVDLFEALAAQNVTINVAAVEPTLTLTTPSPAIGPGQSIQMSVVAQNPHDAELTYLPTSFKISYKVGENGTPVTTDGLKFTLPSDVTLGETVYVWVENVAVDGKYTVGKSDEITLKVGQIDYSADIEKVQENLDKAIAELTNAIANGDEDLATKVTVLQTAMSDAQNAITELQSNSATKTEVEELQKALEDADKALEEAINKVSDDLAAVVNGVDTNETNLATLAQAIADANALITELQNADVTINDRIGALEESLKKAEETLQAKIDEVAKDLEDAKEDLQKQITENKNTITNEVARLDKAIDDANALIKALQDADVAINGRIDTLNAKVDAAVAALNAAIDQVADDLEEARKDLQSKIDKNTATIETEVKRLDELVETTREVLEAADAKNRAELEAEINRAETQLRRAIDSVSNKLTNTQRVLLNVIDAGDKKLDDKITALNTTLSEAIALLETETVAADAALKAELLATIESADKTLDEAIKAVQKNLDDAVAELNKAITDGDADLTEKLSDLDKALKAAEAALKAADDANKTELLAAIEKSEADLTKLITEGDKQNEDALAAAMVVLRAEMELVNKDAQVALTVAVILAVVVILLIAVLVTWFFISKKKRV